jgi:uncharacterized protein (TIGR03437 family)
MNLRTLCCLCYALIGPIVAARSVPGVCGTYPESWREDLDLHQRFERRLAAKPRAARAAAARRDADIGNVAVLENDDSIFGRRNPFNLDGFQVTFTPNGDRYDYTSGRGGFDQTAAAAGAAVTGLGDDDTRRLVLPFPFRFYGNEYREFWLNSDGNITFTAGDDASSARSLGRMSGGPPRIAALFSDLDPSVTSGSIRIDSTAAALTITWLRVPEFSDFGNGRPQTFQMRLTPDGKIGFAWEGVNIADGVVGISPGDTATRALLTTFATTPTGSSASMIAERFGDAQALDLVAASRRFYETHDDAYDYLAFFNANGVQPGSGVLAFETSVRTHRLGIGDTPIDVGRQYGSANRLQAVLNMGPVSNYPSNPNAAHPLRFSTGDTGLTVLAHEIGHLFLAFSSIRNPANPAARPMLGRQLFHWNFRFNSDASILEGNRIRDDGPNANPRFVTTATVQGFSALDQYLMGLRPAEEVEPTFLVENATTTAIDPRVGVGFNGDRREIRVDDLIAVDGRRIPDHTVEQRRYRIAFILIVPEGGTASATDLALLERYREALETSWPRYTNDRGAMDGTLRRAVRLSIEPAAGVIGGANAEIGVSLQQPASTPVTVALRQQNGLLEGPASVVIPAGATTATATFRAVRLGVETLRAEPLSASEYMSTEGRVNIALAARTLQLRVLAGDRQVATPGQVLPEPIVVKLTDENDLPYPNVRIAAVGAGVSPASALTGPDGRASFQWTPTAEPLQVLQFGVAGSPLPVAEVVALGRPVFASTSVVNAASFRPGITPGGIATIFGTNLAQPQVTVEGTAAQVFYADDRQINFAVPALTQASAVASVQVRTALGTATVSVPLLAVQPGIFFDAGSGRAAAIDRGGRIFELYGTGLGAATGVSAQVGGRAADVLFSGLAPGFVGLFQINIRVDGSVAAGEQPASIAAAGIASNEVKLVVAP